VLGECGFGYFVSLYLIYVCEGKVGKGGEVFTLINSCSRGGKDDTKEAKSYSL